MTNITNNPKEVIYLPEWIDHIFIQLVSWSDGSVHYHVKMKAEHYKIDTTVDGSYGEALFNQLLRARFVERFSFSPLPVKEFIRYD